MLMIVSALASCVGGAGGVLRMLPRIVSKWDDSLWRPGSMFMDGFNVRMKIASFIPLFIQSWSEANMERSSLRKW